MIVHTSHSKKDLCDIILIFNLPLEDYKKNVKKVIGEEVMITLMTMDTITPNYDFFEISTLPELIDYLSSPKKRGNISLKEREISILKAKSLIHFVKGCGGTFGNADYDDISQVSSDAEYIKKYADVPTCRMAIRLLNESTILKYKIVPELSYKVQKQLEKKQKIKAGSEATFSSKRGEFLLTFD
jgi:hypothetical protein|tara:strand:- start:2939 stop:3493 length:555 start_codon:yes stop_codon:yes gene_type:complete